MTHQEPNGSRGTPSAEPFDPQDVAATTISEALLRAVLDALPELVFVYSRDGVYVDVLGGRDTTRYHDGRALVGRRIDEVLPADIAAEFLARIAMALDTGEVVAFEYELNRQQVDGIESRDGVPDALHFEGRVAPLPPAPGRDELVVWMAFNVTVHRQMVLELDARQAMLEQLARTDDLTGVRNRRSFFEGIAYELSWTRRTGEPSAVIFLDVDHFKRVNDTWGHAVGDLVLQEVARLLSTDRRGTDVVGRLGGEEFAVVLRGADLVEGRRFAERLRRELAAHRVMIGDREVRVTASFGVAVLRADDHDVDKVVHRADTAMYLAKGRGRNLVVSEDELDGDNRPGDGAVVDD